MKCQARQVALTMTDTTITPGTAELLITELRALDPAHRLLGLYALGLSGCASSDLNRVVVVLHELICSLDFRHSEIAESFHRLYTFCLEQAGAGAFERVSFIFHDLHDTLQRAVDEQTVAPVSAAAAS
jgi:hypothetical protein